MSELKQKEGRNISVHLLNFCEENHDKIQRTDKMALFPD